MKLGHRLPARPLHPASWSPGTRGVVCLAPGACWVLGAGALTAHPLSRTQDEESLSQPPQLHLSSSQSPKSPAEHPPLSQTAEHLASTHTRAVCTTRKHTHVHDRPSNAAHTHTHKGKGPSHPYTHIQTHILGRTYTTHSCKCTFIYRYPNVPSHMIVCSFTCFMPPPTPPRIQTSNTG